MCLGMTNRNCIPKEVKILNLGDAGYCLGQNLLSPQLLLKDLKSKIHKIIILPVVLYVCVWNLVCELSSADCA
jgi:hypothetical protein